MYGLRFLEHCFTNKEDLKLTLFYIAPRPAAVWEGEETHETRNRADKQAGEYQTRGRKALEEATKELIQFGFDQDRITTKLQFRQRSKVLDIVQEAEKGLYDAVVLGRRGISWLEEVFDESVTKGLLEKKVTFPLWVCRRPELDRRHVLLCVDGSDEANRIADHVGYILAPEKEHEVTIFLVRKEGAILKKSDKEILSQARERLLSNGFSAELVKSKIVDSSKVPETIRTEAERGRFMAVAVGRTGASQGLLKRVFMGSVSKTLFQELEGAALWICQ
jgi:nucleotide-binding universal stress UspA family protein